ncbi:MAG TPA: hydantoinase/oxoprolinase family protein, partial [Caulobacteraceae bacterium]
VDDLGLMKVGPRSAGSQPGPACYGQGGREPTVTDADLMLGLLAADNFLGGDMKLDAEAARRALQSLGDKLGVDAAQAAAGVYRIVAETMAGAARAHATDRGVDYRGLALLAFGGAGPVHACAVGALLDSTAVIFPPQASVLSAFGALVTPVRLDLVRSALGNLEAMDWGEVDALLSEMSEEGFAALEEAGVAREAVSLTFGADLRYFGQQNELTIAFETDPREARDVETIRAVFEGAYKAQYGVNPSHVPVEIVGWRLTARGPDIALTHAPPAATAPGAPRAHRPVALWSPVDRVPVYDRASLAIGQTLTGPAIIEERETTIVLPPAWRAEVNALGCIVARAEEGA